jgi:hypothetical protein
LGFNFNSKKLSGNLFVSILISSKLAFGEIFKPAAAT